MVDSVSPADEDETVESLVAGSESELQADPARHKRGRHQGGGRMVGAHDVNVIVRASTVTDKSTEIVGADRGRRGTRTPDIFLVREAL